MTDSAMRRCVYRRGSYPGQVDHPGWLSKVVEGRAELEASLAEGWGLTMADTPLTIPPVKVDIWPLPEPAPDFSESLGPPRGWVDPSTPKSRGRKARG